MIVIAVEACKDRSEYPWIIAGSVSSCGKGRPPCGSSGKRAPRQDTNLDFSWRSDSLMENKVYRKSYRRWSVFYSVSLAEEGLPSSHLGLGAQNKMEFHVVGASRHLLLCGENHKLQKDQLTKDPRVPCRYIHSLILSTSYWTPVLSQAMF